ncbi:SDR family NAD(P)-dependent oxidoreductase [Arcicella lustrica]|uniref:SDR family oxidoreductase n=1 Tax=Arcicella lustrica TaxID=2984196 RepID=A0ABU5SJV5_9BACT|nr:SDR family oxidoreductase [Arcicella sp. DC25W]MEA5427564.1 SDR family oxidoreductase [Arcicella sp. DC25W]
MSKNILIIGASSGIGEATAQILNKQGFNVYDASRTEPSVATVKHFTWDALNPDNTVFNELPDVLDGLIYCAGTINLKPFARLSQEDFKNDFQINVLGAVAVIQAVLPRLKKSNSASIVLYSTVAVKVGMGFHASVASSKGAIEGLTRSLAAEFAPNKIRVNCIAPSLTETPLAKNLLSSEEKKEASNKRHPIGRFGNVSDIASMTSFLISDDASWITGQVLNIDGGMSSIKTM